MVDYRNLEAQEKPFQKFFINFFFYSEKRLLHFFVLLRFVHFIFIEKREKRERKTIKKKKKYTKSYRVLHICGRRMLIIIHK